MKKPFEKGRREEMKKRNSWRRSGNKKWSYQFNMK